MEYIIAIASIIIFPLLVGYVKGCKNTDPFTSSGKSYYK